LEVVLGLEEGLRAQILVCSWQLYDGLAGLEIKLVVVSFER